MGLKLLWTGLVLIMAINAVIAAFGGNSSDLLVTVGALLMVIGLVLYWLDK